VQVFKHDHLLAVHQSPGLLVQEVLTLIAYLTMSLRHCLHSLFPAMTPTLLTRQRFLQLLQLLLCFAIVARIVEKLSIGQSGKVGHSQVNTHILIGHFQRLGLADLTGKARIPVFSFPLDRERFDRARHIPGAGAVSLCLSS
jgi:hypothetical protein